MGQVDLVAPGVHFLHLRYHVGDPDRPGSGFSGATESGWVDSWQSNLPLAVEITMGAAPMADGQSFDDYVAKNEVFRRIVFLPGSRIPPVGASSKIGGIQP